MLRLGLVGLGLVGVPIARRLLGKGWRLTVWDMDSSLYEPLKDSGARWALSPGDVRAASDVVLICQPSSTAVELVCFGAAGLSSTRGAHIVIDLSGTGMDVTLRASQTLDVAWLDSPMTGDAEAAGKGELTLMVGGTEELFDWVRPVLNDLSSNLTLMGPLGAGQTSMLINQAIVGMSYVMLAEVLAQVRTAGIDPHKLLQSLKGSIADSNMLQAVLPRMIGRDFADVRTRAGRMHDHMQALRAFNETAGLTLPMQEIAIDQFRHLAEDQGGEVDAAAVAALYDPD